MKKYYYLDGIEKFGPFNEEELLSKDLADDVIILDVDTNESYQYKDIKDKIKLSETVDINVQSCDEDKCKNKSSKSTVIKILIGVLVVTAIMTPRIISNIIEKESDEAINELIDNGKISATLEDYTTYKDGGFSFKYPSSYTIVTDSLYENGIHLFSAEVNDYNDIMMVYHMKNSNILSLEEKRDVCFNFLNIDCKELVLNAAESADFDSITQINSEDKIVKYKMNFSCAGFKGKAISAVDDNYGYMAIIMCSDDFYYNVTNRYINEISIK